VIAAAHVRWGSGIGGRAREIALLADWAERYAAAPRTLVRDVLLVGDFNLPSVKSETFRMLEARGFGALEARGFGVPEALANVFGTDPAKQKRYDQILRVPHGATRFSGAGGALDFYAGSHRALFPRLKWERWAMGGDMLVGGAGCPRRSVVVGQAA
jgi:hypothetical protein